MNFHEATADDLAALGWPRWSEASGLYLCPLAQFNDVPDGVAFHSISGSVAVKGRDYIDDDTRGGMLAFGIIPGRTRTVVSAEEVARHEAARRATFQAEIAGLCAENGLLDLTTGEMLHGEKAAEAILEMRPPARG